MHCIDVLRLSSLSWPNPTLEEQCACVCVCVCVSLLGYRLKNHWHYWRLTELLFETGWRPATQICDLEGANEPGTTWKVMRCLTSGSECQLHNPWRYASVYLYMCGKLYVYLFLSQSESFNLEAMTYWG